MNVSVFLLRMFIKLGIRFYQKCLSPLKGYRCAHAHIHKGTSCSAAVLNIVMKMPISQWRKLIKKRFFECKEAYQYHLTSSESNKENDDKEGKNKNKRRYASRCDSAECSKAPCEAINCGDSLGRCGGSAKQGFNKCNVDDCGLGVCDIGSC